MKLLHPVSLALGLTLTSASYGEQFAIDPSQSYVEVDIPYWVRDEPSPAYFDAQPGETNALGYSWHVETQPTQYALSGHFEWIASGLEHNVHLHNIQLFANTPQPWQLQLPTVLRYDALTGQITNTAFDSSLATSCPSGWHCSTFTLTPYPTFSASFFGHRNGQWIQMAGVQSRPDVLYVNVVGGGSEPPSDNFLLNDPTIRYTIFATAVPEASQYTLLLVSIPLFLLSVLRRRRIRTAPTFTGTAT